ncbi:MAG: NAD(P)H-hydrate dehydratase [Dehalococcoidales bacterium]|nr:NAD(P)H-hydrate dehydratase [Dehalococcoidales bacterium]
MLVIAGTIPIDGMPLTQGSYIYQKDKVTIGDYTLEGKYITLGTAAMASAASVACQTLGIDPPHLVTYGDTGMGDGTLKILDYLSREIGNMGADVLTLHYLLPTKEPFIKLVDIVNNLDKKPFFIADAGALLNAKATGLAKKFDLFTPDPGELSFIADPEAPHPAYVQHFIFEVDDKEIPRLSKEAYDNGNAPKYLLIKAAVDHIVVDGEVVGNIREPLVPSLEAIGGTGDTITGVVSALISSGMDVSEAMLKAAHINRYMGELAQPSPATPISELIPYIPEAIKKVI